jgi:hypothetical protein
MPSEKVRVMISSRCNDSVELDGKSVALSNLRKRLKQEIEAAVLFGGAVFEVWINEDAPAAEGSNDAWEECLGQIREADIVLVLYNGNSGWAKEGGGIGICHAEFQMALASSGNRVRLIELPLQTLRKGVFRQQDERFRKFVTSQGLFRAAAQNGNDAINKAKEALRTAVVQMVRDGARSARRPRFDAGEALDWSRLDFRARQFAIEATLRKALLARSGAENTAPAVSVPINGKQVLFLCHGIPAAIGVAAARELVGQPFLMDHKISPLLEKRIGPVHLIGCHRSVTEAQASRMLGFPDATTVSPAFGVFVADNIQKIQLVLIANCREESMTRHGLQRVFDWLEQTGEDSRLAERAAARARIVRSIANESESA